MAHDTTVEDRLDFFGIDQNDIARFPRIARRMARLAPPALDRFYAKVRTVPALAAKFSGQPQMDLARSKQIEHWAELFSQRPGAAYLERAERIGNVHARIGLDPTWYIGGYSRVLSEVVERAVKGSLGGMLDGGRTAGEVATLVKVALLDMEVALSAYFKAEECSRLEAIEAIGVALAALADSDFTSSLSTLPPEYARITEDFERMRKSVAGALTDVANAARSVSHGATEIRQAADDLAIRTQNDAATLEETSAALHELTRGVRRTADGAKSMSDRAATSQQSVADGRKVVSEAVDAMEASEKSANQIRAIIDLIDGIAFQTNLLALNAGVEAARAGEAGKGFAVVASEVRLLAQRSADAASEIKSLIIQSVENVERGAQLVAQSGVAFDGIAGLIGELAELSASVAEVTGAQSVSLDTINTALNEMDHATQQNAALVEEASAAARSLAEESRRLQELSDGFRLEGVDVQAPQRRQYSRAA
ncbi:globin-coupled sensor protein [Alteraurantiacibacter buctensis]|uniref:Globin-coupled sensor protein n=1 Tax=Alteraurantiacibacter buctensis TaxID=1503981 RepID=A0A844YV81_9SPHN|nr:globin-coupled sensor protein [Alteraurantiacibacter buctensis]MXO70751.1 globin-coupled sensor protein [Alteraurantiacibacter buctensis]